ncbi:MAG: hypothetical protein AAFN77_05875 [Planctomycetota bacterium]
MTLLIVGGESDPNTRRVVDQAHVREVDYFFWNTDEGGCLDIAWDFKSPELDLGRHRIRPSSVFMRWNVFGGDSNANLSVHEMIQAYAMAWPKAKLLNRRSLLDANNKSFNLRLAEHVGFQIPETIVLSNLEPLSTIPDPESRIAKPLNGGAHTQQVNRMIENPAMLNQKPQFIQEKLDGENLRLFSIGGELFCFHLKTDQLDYREDQHVEVIQVDVPAELIGPTKRLVARKSFDYCALDFRCRNSFTDPVFLEVNSFPMFVRFDDAGENCLVDAILDFLVAGSTRREQVLREVLAGTDQV